MYLFLGGLVAGHDDHRRGTSCCRGRHREETCVCSCSPGAQPRAPEPRHAGALPRPRAQAVRLAAVHDLPAWLADVVGRVDPGARLSGARWRVLRAAGRPTLRPRIWTGFDRLTRPARRAAGRRVIAVANMVLGVVLGIYTGILLSALGARPLWNSAILGPLFLVSGLSSAAAFVHLVARHAEEREMLAKSDNVFLAIELFVSALFLDRAAQRRRRRTSTRRGSCSAARSPPSSGCSSSGWASSCRSSSSRSPSRTRIRHTPLAPRPGRSPAGSPLRFVIVFADRRARLSSCLARTHSRRSESGSACHHERTSIARRAEPPRTRIRISPASASASSCSPPSSSWAAASARRAPSARWSAGLDAVAPAHAQAGVAVCGYLGGRAPAHGLAGLRGARRASSARSSRACSRAGR